MQAFSIVGCKYAYNFMRKPIQMWRLYSNCILITTYVSAIHNISLHHI